MATAPPPPSGGVERAPVLLRSLAAAVLTDGGGDLSLPREARGAIDDWGGVYAQLVRLTGPWRVSVFDGAEDRALGASLVTGRTDGERWFGEHAVGPLRLRQTIAPTEHPAGALRSVRVSVADGPARMVVVTCAFVPFLLPTMVEGIRPREFRAETSADGLTVRQRGFALTVRASVAPARLLWDRASWLGGRRTGPVEELATEHELEVAPGRDAEIRWVIGGGLRRDLDREATGLAAAVEAEGDRPPPIDAADAAWLASTPRLEFPDAPELERAYATARRALRRLYTAPDATLAGLVAGYPWYGSIWSRDVAWMLPALLWLGDFDWAARSIDTILRFQARSELPLLGGEPGELPMQVSPGPVFLYGTSDTTLYFPELVRRWGAHAGDPAPIAAWRPAVRRMVAWGLARTDPTTGLLRNGGEAEAISAATGALARVRYGIDAPDTTIWDSADRRDHAIDVQVLWWQALRAANAIDPLGTEAGGPAAWAIAADRLATAIPARYAWPDERYLYDSIRGGRPVAVVRPNALRAVSVGLIDPPTSRAIVARAAEPDLTTAWGVRTRSARDPGYRPDAYHEGQVWPIATAWLADAAFAVGATDLGVDLLRGIAARFAAEGGGANECYRGDRPEAFDSCFLLGLSVGPFVTVLFERLWGLEVDAAGPRLRIDPKFPAAWRTASIDGLRVGRGTVRLRFDAGSLEVAWSGPGALAVDAPGTAASVAPGTTARLALARAGGVPPEPS